MCLRTCVCLVLFICLCIFLCHSVCGLEGRRSIKVFVWLTSQGDNGWKRPCQLQWALPQAPVCWPRFLKCQPTLTSVHSALPWFGSKNVGVTADFEGKIFATLSYLPHIIPWRLHIVHSYGIWHICSASKFMVTTILRCCVPPQGGSFENPTLLPSRDMHDKFASPNYNFLHFHCELAKTVCSNFFTPVASVSSSSLILYGNFYGATFSRRLSHRYS